MTRQKIYVLDGRKTRLRHFGHSQRAGLSRRSFAKTERDKGVHGISAKVGLDFFNNVNLYLLSRDNINGFERKNTRLVFQFKF
jgi:hypothetical protein